MKPLRFFWLAPLLLVGCNNSTPPQSARDLASAWVSADLSDRIVRALRADDSAQLQSAAHQLETVGFEQQIQIARATVPTLTARAEDVMREGNLTPRASRRGKADQRYRAALAFLPRDYNDILALDLDAGVANSLGYHLADRGTTREDFALAEFLTSLSVYLYDKRIGDASLSEEAVATLRYFRAVGPGDSLAWALFKQGRFREARAKQEAVLAIAQDELPDGEELSADLPFHLAEIYRALGENRLAQTQYRLALSLEPDAELRAQIEKRLAPS